MALYAQPHLGYRRGMRFHGGMVEGNSSATIMKKAHPFGWVSGLERGGDLSKLNPSSL